MIRKISWLVLVAVLALLPAASVAMAGPPGSLNPSGDYSAALNERMAALDERLASLPERAAAIDDRQKGLDSRTAAYNQQSKDVLAQLDATSKKISDHNARVAAYPRGAPPAIANAYNAEARALNAELQRLKAQANAIADEGNAINTSRRELSAQKDALDAERSKLARERKELLRQLASTLAALASAAGPIPGRSGGDMARPPSRASRGEPAPAAGGDPVSRKAQGAALGEYANKHGVDVDKRQVTARLSPSSVTRLSPDKTANLQLLRRFDGLVRKPDGRYKALYTTPPGGAPHAGHKAFDDAIAAGGSATAVVDGKKIIIDEVEQVTDPSMRPDACPASNSFVAGTPVLLADGSTLPIERLAPGDQVHAADPATSQTGSHRVTGTRSHESRRTLVAISVGTGSVVATDEHPFWDATDRRWTRAIDLKPGHRLETADHRDAVVTGTRSWSEVRRVYNLTVDTLHTYYVQAGTSAVLVHNSNVDQQTVPPCRGTIPESVMDHILKGEIKENGSVKGYHHRPGGQDRHGWKTTHKTPPNINGVYSGTVTARIWDGNTWREKVVSSTFFPDSWSEAQVRHAVLRAFTEARSFDEQKGEWRGVYRGIHIKGYYDPTTGELKTAFPLLE